MLSFFFGKPLGTGRGSAKGHYFWGITGSLQRRWYRQIQGDSGVVDIVRKKFTSTCGDWDSAFESNTPLFIGMLELQVHNVVDIEYRHIDPDA